MDQWNEKQNNGLNENSANETLHQGNQMPHDKEQGMQNSQNGFGQERSVIGQDSFRQNQTTNPQNGFGQNRQMNQGNPYGQNGQMNPGNGFGQDRQENGYGQQNRMEEPRVTPYGTSQSYGTYQRSQAPVKPVTEKKQSESTKVFKKAVGIALAAVLFGSIAGGAFVGVNVLQNKMTGTNQASTQNTAPEVAQSAPATTEDSAEAALSKSESHEAATVHATPVSGEELTVKQIVANNMSCIVAITNKGVTEVRTMWGNFEQESQSSGSGIIIGKTDSELLIVTNYHVISGSKELTVVFSYDEKSEEPNAVSAKVKGYEENRDLAVIAVPIESLTQEMLNEISVATIGDSNTLDLGEQVVAIGNALGYGQSVTVGYVSALDRSLTLEAEDGSELQNKYIQTDAAINPGNSGGALFNMQGELIGINSAKAVDNSVEGMGYAIPITQVSDIIQELMNSVTRDVVPAEKRGYLGISGTSVDSSVSQTYGIPVGAYVSEVRENSAAQRAGIVAKDIITKVDNKNVTSFDSLMNILNYYEAGETISVTVSRQSAGGYEDVVLSVTLCSAEEAGITQQNQQNVNPNNGGNGGYYDGGNNGGSNGGSNDYYDNPFRYFFGF